MGKKRRDFRTSISFKFNPYRVKPYSNFKPGQTTLDRDYYAGATHEKPSGSKCLDNFQRFGSDYNKGVSTSVKPGDYVVPSKDANNLGRCPLFLHFVNKDDLYSRV